MILDRKVAIVEKSCETGSVRSNQPIEKTDIQPTALSTELYVRTDAVVARYVAGETLVLPVRGDIGDLACFYSFNGTGTTIWEALEKPKSFKDVCDAIKRKYDVSRKRVEEDVVLFVREICSLGLAQVVIDSENLSGMGNDKSAINSSDEYKHGAFPIFKQRSCG